MLQNNLLTNYKETAPNQTQAPELLYFLHLWKKYNYPQCQHFKNEEVLIRKDSRDTETAAQLLSYFDQGTAWSY